MSFRLTSVVSRSLTRNARNFAAAPTPSDERAKGSARIGAYVSMATLVGIGTYFYINTSAAGVKPLKIQEKSPLDPKEWINFPLKRVEPYNHNTSKFIFKLPDDQASLLPVASCLMVRAADPESLKDKNGKPVARPYTPISPSDYPGELALLIKKYPDGLASTHVHNLKPGDQLGIKGPFPKFEYKINQFEQVALIGGGSGITPLYQILTHALANKSNTTKFTLLFSNVTEADILLREEVDELKKKYPNELDVVYILDRPDDKWKGPKGYITADLVKKHAGPASLGDKVKVFVCGPPPQVAAIAGKKAGSKQGEIGGVLKELGYSEDQVYKF